MADPITVIGLVASVLQFVAIARSAIDVGNDTLNAPKEQRTLFLEIQTLEPLLQDLQTRLLLSNQSSHTQRFTEPLTQLDQTLKRVTEKLRSAQHPRRTIPKALGWTLWNKREAEGDLAKIERFKSLLNTWLTLDNWVVGQEGQEYHEQHRRDHERILNSTATAEREKIIEWLSPLNFFARHLDIFGTRQDGTGQWLIEDGRFRRWISTSGETIWCRGIPGAGKTVLASIVVDYLRTHFQNDKISVAAAYLNHKESDVQSPSNILAGLWWQLVSQNPLSAQVQQLYQKHQKQRTRLSLDEIRDILRSAISEYSRVFIVVDALDEYPENKRHILLEALAEMGGTVSLMLTSRPHIAPGSFLADAQVLEIRAKEDDIRHYVEAHLRTSFRLSKHVAADRNCVERSRVRFLLAKLHIESLATKNTVKAVRDALKHLPKDLEHTYNEAMDRIESQNEDDREIARRTLIWVANAKRPLLVSELREALAIEPGSKALDMDGFLDIDIILSVCAGLIIVDQAVRLVHHTTQDYFDRVQAIRFPRAQTEITSRCLTYLSFDELSVDFKAWEDSWKLYRTHKLLLYASHYCLVHAAGEPELLLRDSIVQFLGDAHRWRSPFLGGRVPSQWHSANWPPVPSKLWVATLFGLQEVARYLLESDPSISETEKKNSLIIASQWNRLGIVQLLIKHGTGVNAVGGASYGNALHAASTWGHVAVVQELIANGADVNIPGKTHSTPLTAALERGHEGVFHLLIQNGADVNAPGGLYRTPLQTEVAKGNDAAVRLLLDNGADVNAQGGHFGNALQAASAKESITMVQLLLDNGADVNAQGGHFGNALQAASAKESITMVQLLLDNGADVNAQGGHFGNALQAASAKESITMVQLLLDNGSDVNAQGGHFGNALEAAAARGNLDIVQLLFAKSADVNAQGGLYGNALGAALKERHNTVAELLIQKGAETRDHLQAASAAGDVTVVRLLLDSGADVNAQGGTHGTALGAASAEGHHAIVQLLIEKGADVDAQDGSALYQAMAKKQQTVVELLIENGASLGKALQVALAKGNVVVVQLLIENGADVNDSGGFYGSALQAAAAMGNLAGVQMLLEKGADVNAQGGHFGNALLAASHRGNEKVVRLLLDEGAEVNALAHGGEGGTALQRAVKEGHDRVAMLLIEKGADVNVRGGEYGNVLQARAQARHWGEAMVQLIQRLIEYGADVNAHGGRFGSALQAASLRGNIAVVQLLLENGADVNARGGKHGTALAAASAKGQDVVAQLLLEKGAAVNAQGGRYGNALQAACQYGNETVVQLLLKKGADVNAQGGHYGNALQAAAAEGHITAAQLLLEKGADVNAQGGEYSTALQAASYWGHHSMIRLLLEKGAAVNAQTLQAAVFFSMGLGRSWEKSREVMRLLLYSGTRGSGNSML